MRWFPVILGSGLFLGLSNAALAAPNKSTKHYHVVSGKVIDVQRDDANKNTGTVKVRVHNHHKRNVSVGVAKTKSSHSRIVTVHVHSKTKYSKVLMHKSLALQQAPASFAEVHKGEHVHIHVSSKHHKAHHVAILMQAKGITKANLAKMMPIKPSAKPKVRKR